MAGKDPGVIRGGEAAGTGFYLSAEAPGQSQPLTYFLSLLLWVCQPQTVVSQTNISHVAAKVATGRP